MCPMKSTVFSGDGFWSWRWASQKEIEGGNSIIHVIRQDLGPKWQVVSEKHNFSWNKTGERTAPWTSKDDTMYFDKWDSEIAFTIQTWVSSGYFLKHS